MAYEEERSLKRYYSIAEVAEILEVNKSLIRFWETRFPQLKPNKNSKGDRRFTGENLKLLREIYFLVKVRGFTIEGAGKELQRQKIKREETRETLVRMRGMRDFLAALREKL